MSEGYPGGGGGGGGGGGQQQVVVDGVVAGGGGCLPFYHVPQQCRREKLRYPNANEPPPPPSLHPHAPPTPSPPSLLHYNATATASFMSPASSSYHLLNPSSSSAAPYDHGGVTAFNLLDHHALFGGDHRQGQGVSLSLSSSVASSSHHAHHGDLLGAPALAGPLPLVPVAPRVGPVPAGPFTGYATILKGSRFLRPAQHLLEEVCGGGGGGGGGGSALGALAGSGADAEPSDFAAEGVDDCDKIADGSISGEQRRLKTRLVSMLDEVYRRYKLYYQQIQAVITSFEAVAGLNMAAPYAPLALKSLSKHFKCLKHAISDQLRFTNEAFGKETRGKDEISGCRFMNGSFCYQRAGLSSGPINQQPVWRPQRGLPERAVAVLRAWLFEHFLHPYPSDMDKQMLAKQTGLSRNQVSNWFINARVRLWKPMVEEIHSLELRQARKIPESENNRGSNKQPELSAASVFSPASEQTPPNASPQRNEGLPHKRFHNELAHIASHIQGPVNFSLDDLSSHHRVGVPLGVTNGGNGGVSLTLGLHQNNGICLSEPLPLNVVRRFGLEESNVAFVMGGFEGQERQFGKEFDGQLLRDFVA